MPKDNYDLPIPKFGSNATKFPPNVFGTQTPLDLTDPQYLKNIVSNGNYAKGQEGNATADGLYARSDIENENAKILFINGFLADRIFPRGLFAYSSSAEYYQHSTAVEISTGKIFQSLQDSNIGKPLTDTAWWLDTGQTIQTLYTNITNLYSKKGKLTTVSSTTLTIEGGFLRFDDDTGGFLFPNGTITFASLTGTNANQTRYIFALYNPATGATQYLADTSYPSPTLPTGFTKKAYLGSIIINTVNTGFEVGIFQGQKFTYTTNILLYNTLPVNDTWTAYSLLAPIKDNIEVRCYIGYTYTGNDVVALNAFWRTTGTTGEHIIFAGAVNGYSTNYNDTDMIQNSVGQVDLKLQYTSPTTDFIFQIHSYTDYDIQI